MASEQLIRAGFVALVGRPNVGKSTLLNALLGEKVAIVSPKPQTTRTRINGILNRDDAQLIFVDTPGVSRGKTRLHQAMGRLGGTAAADAEVALVILAPGKGDLAVAPEDRQLVAKARAESREVVVALNKTDRVRPKARMLPWIEQVCRELAAETVVPISALRGDGLDDLVAALLALLPLGPPLFPRDIHTDSAERFLCEELVREQLLVQTQQEVPHAAVVVIETFEDERREDGGLCRIEGRIIVERASQKAIVIGKGGARIRQLSEQARHEIEALLGCKVFLRMNVHVDPGWTDNARALRRYGLDGASG